MPICSHQARRLPPVTLVVHGIGNLDETSNVGASNQRWELAIGSWNVLASSADTVLEAVAHNILQARVDLLARPVDALRILRHLETGNGDTTGVGGLAWSVPDAVGLLLLAGRLEDVNGLLGAAHVGSLGDELAAAGDKGLGLLLADLVLGGAWKGDIDLDVRPWALTLQELVVVVLEGGQWLALNLKLGNLVDILWGEVLELLGDQAAGGIGHGDDGGAELDGLESGVLGDVAGTGNGDGLALEGALLGVGDHVINVVDETVTSGLWADERSSPASSLSGENSLPLVAVGAVCAEQPSDLAAGNANITGWNVGIGTNVLGQLAHESNAELADLVVRLALWIEVCSSLATTNVHCGDC